MTNNHVISNKRFASKLKVTFDYQYDYDSNMPPQVYFEFAPDEFFLTNPELDYTVIKMKDAAARRRKYKETSLHKFIYRAPTISRNQRPL